LILENEKKSKKIKNKSDKIFAPFKVSEVPIIRKYGYDKVTDIIEAWIILKLIHKAWAFFSIWDKKTQWKDKLVQLLSTDAKIMKHLESEIQNKIKDMRMWKKVLDDDSLETELEEIENVVEEVVERKE
jgi:hypothetical protein